MVSGYSLLDSGFKTNAATLLHHLQGLQGALRVDRHREGAERARDPDDALPGGARDRGRHRVPGRRRRRFPASAPPAASSSGSRTPPPASRRGSIDLTQEVIRKARERPRAHRPAHHVPRDHAAAARRRGSRQGDAARRADPGRVQRDPGAVRLDHRQPVHTSTAASWWVILQSDPKFREPPDDLTRLYTRSSHGLDGAAVGAGDDRVGHRPRPAAALQRLPGGEDQRQRRARLQLGPGDRGDGGDRARGAAGGLHVRLVRARVRGEEVGRHVDDRVRLRPDHRVPGARRAVRVVDAARRGHDGGAVRRSSAR